MVHVNDKYLAGSPDNDPFRSKNIEFLKDSSGCFIVETNGPNGTKPKIRLDLRILPDVFAKQCPAGPARNEPNLDPFLPPPVGRIILTFNPCKMIVSQILCLIFSLEPTDWQKDSNEDLLQLVVDRTLHFADIDDPHDG